MQAGHVLDRLLRKICPDMHKLRRTALFVNVMAGLHGAVLTVTHLGHAISSDAKEKHCIKRADRLLSNRRLQRERLEVVMRGRERLAQNRELAAHPANLLEAMLATPLGSDPAFTDEEIYGNVFTMLLAGEDTTANTMAWMTHFMIEHPEAQARMQAEAVQVLSHAGMLSQLADAERLNYIETVTHETMRLKPVAPLLFLESIEDIEIGGVSVTKGTALFLLTMHAGLQDTHFGAADKFRPERWIEAAPASCCPHNAKAFVPFGAGPRFCPGRQLAMVEIKTVMLCAGFEVSKTGKPQPVGEIFSFTMMPENLFVRFKRRARREVGSGESSAL